MKRTYALPCGLLGLLAIACLACAGRKPDDRLVQEFIGAKAQYERGELSAALDVLRKVYDRDPTFFQASFLYGKAAYFRGEASTAYKVFASLGAAYPDSVESALWLARCRFDAKLVKEAEAGLSRLLARNPDDARILFQLAVVREAQGKPQDALVYLKRAQAGSDDQALAYLESARLYYQIGDAAAAKADLSRASAVAEPASPLRAAIRQLAVALGGGK